MPDGDLVLCPSKPDGVDFLKAYNAWGFVRISQTPKYLALYLSQPVSAIQYVAEIDKVIEPSCPESPVRPEDAEYREGTMLLLLKKGRVWELAEPVLLGAFRPGKAPQSIRYHKLSNLANARTLDDL